MSRRHQRLVIGMGKSGMSVAAYWYREHPVTIIDDRHHPPRVDALTRQLPAANIQCDENFRRWRARDYEQYELIAVSPGIDLKDIAADAGQLTNDMMCFSDAWQQVAPAESRLFAVTGTNGKSTVTALAAHLINSSGRTAEAMGNIGEPALNALMRWQRYGFPQAAVVELSSFHLELATQFYSDAAVVLNVSDDHLDRHKDIKHYAEIKRRIYNNSRRAVCNRAANLYADLSAETSYSIASDDADWTVKDRWICRGGEARYRITEMSVACQNYLELVLAALALTESLQLPPDGVYAGLASFAGLPHRRQIIAAHDEIIYIDDSKATNVEAALFALSPRGSRIVWLGGGDGKGQDFRPLAAAAEVMRAAVLFGKDAAAISAVLTEAGVRCEQAGDLPAAVSLARSLAQPGDTVLLSPACSSLDMFTDYRMRGVMFARAVQQLHAGQGK